MKEQVIYGLWSAHSKLSNHEPLEKAEQEAVLTFLKKGLGFFYPTKKEYENYKEALQLVNNGDLSPKNEAHFIPKITIYEQKYLSI